MEKIRIITHIFTAPFAAFGMILLWAVMGIPMIGAEKIMLEEWFVCIGVYFLAVLLSLLKKTVYK